jgi:hypothetical protein
VRVTAAALLERFAVYGHFYQRTLDGKRRELRSRLEIFEAGSAWPGVADADADLIAIMMNPGASRPTVPIDADGWAPAVPDRTQYQLMKLALYAQSRGLPIRHVRVINLSDIRTPKSGELFATLQTLSDDRHSMFSSRRHLELARALGGPKVPVLRAWGLAPQLTDLATQCVKLTQDRKVLGLTDDGLRYRHPLPQRADLQQAWLAQACAQLDARGQGSNRAGSSKDTR